MVESMRYLCKCILRNDKYMPEGTNRFKRFQIRSLCRWHTKHKILYRLKSLGGRHFSPVGEEEKSFRKTVVNIFSVRLALTTYGRWWHKQTGLRLNTTCYVRSLDQGPSGGSCLHHFVVLGIGIGPKGLQYTSMVTRRSNIIFCMIFCRQ